MRISKDPKVRRQEIIDTAKVLFQYKGIGKTSISEIARNIGVAKGLIYYYFDSKEQLVQEVVEDFIQGVDGELSKIVNNMDFDFYEKLMAILDLYFHSIQKHPVIFSYSPHHPEIFSLIKDRLSQVALYYAKDLIQLGLKQGIIQLQYPEYMLKIIIEGLGDLYIQGITDPKIHIVLIEQLLGLEKGILHLE